MNNGWVQQVGENYGCKEESSIWNTPYQSMKEKTLDYSTPKTLTNYAENLNFHLINMNTQENNSYR